jgi:hypothetical protein
MCSVAGTYDETCINGAISAATPGDTIVLSQVFTINTKISLFSKTDLSFIGIGGGGLKAKTALNDTLITATDCDRCVFNNVLFDGNKANQSSGNLYGLELFHSDQVTVTNCTFRNTGGDSLVDDSNGTIRLGPSIIANRFTGSATSYIWIKNSRTGQLISHNTFGLLSGSPRNQGVMTIKSATAISVMSNMANSGGSVGYFIVFDTSVSGVAYNNTGNLGFPGSVVTYINGASSASLAVSIGSPLSKTANRTALAAACTSGGGHLSGASTQAASVTIDCNGTPPQAIAGVLASTTEYLIYTFPDVFLYSGATVSAFATFYAKGGSSGTPANGISWACTDIDQTLGNPTFSSEGGGGTVSTNDLLLGGAAGGTSGLQITSASLTSAGCTGFNTTLFIKVRKAAGSTFNGSMYHVGARISYQEPI